MVHVCGLLPMCKHCLNSLCTLFNLILRILTNIGSVVSLTLCTRTPKHGRGADGSIGDRRAPWLGACCWWALFLFFRESGHVSTEKLHLGGTALAEAAIPTCAYRLVGGTRSNALHCSLTECWVMLLCCWMRTETRSDPFEEVRQEQGFEEETEFGKIMTRQKPPKPPQKPNQNKAFPFL